MLPAGWEQLVVRGYVALWATIEKDSFSFPNCGYDISGIRKVWYPFDIFVESKSAPAREMSGTIPTNPVFCAHAAFPKHPTTQTVTLKTQSAKVFAEHKEMSVVHWEHTGAENSAPTNRRKWTEEEELSGIADARKDATFARILTAKLRKSKVKLWYKLSIQLHPERRSAQRREIGKVEPSLDECR